ncbi:MAG: M23 family metallopeptidase [Trueperaceae bacterium]
MGRLEEKVYLQISVQHDTKQRYTDLEKSPCQRKDRYLWAMFGFLSFLAILAFSQAQVLPDGADGVPFECPPPDEFEVEEEPQDEAERLEQARRAAYRVVLPAYLAAVPPEPDTALLMPVEGITVSQITDTWGAPRGGGRIHEGQDIFAEEGTPIYASAPGYIYRIGQDSPLGGNTITIVTGGGNRHYYAHLQAFSEDIREGQYVTPDTLLGYVGNTGNAITTPPHLHFGVYTGEAENLCEWDAFNPLPLLIDR